MLHRVGREHGELALLVRLDVLRGRAGYLVGWASKNTQEMPGLQDPLLSTTQPVNQPFLHSLWGALLQAFTVEDVFQRKIK